MFDQWITNLSIPSIENDGSDVAQKMIELKEQFQRARECVDKLPGVQFSQEEQLRLKSVLQEQLIVKNELLMNYKSGNHFDNLGSNGDIPSNLSNVSSTD